MTAITEVTGLDGSQIVMQDIFQFKDLKMFDPDFAGDVNLTKM